MYSLLKVNSTGALPSTTWYFYNTAGNVTRVVTMDESASRERLPFTRSVKGQFARTYEDEDSSPSRGTVPVFTATRS